MEEPTFRDRTEGGRLLAGRLAAYAGRGDVLVLALPRGGVPVAYEVAVALGAPLDVIVARKLGVPGNPELGMGAVAGGGIRVVDARIVRALGIPPRLVERVARTEGVEVERREHAYRTGPLPEVAGKTVVLVDDGIATGSTVQAAVAALRRRCAGRIVVAAPVAPAATCTVLRTLADEVVCVREPRELHSVGAWYRSFPQTSDPEVRDLLARARAGRGTETTPP